MNNHAELFKYTIAAGGKQVVNATGTKLFVRTALQPFSVKFDTGAQIELEDGFRFTSDKQFTRLEVSNANAAALYVEFYVSDASVERDAPLYIRDAVTIVGPNSTNTSLAAGVTSAVFAAAPAGKHRKEVIIGNVALAGNELEIVIELTPSSFTSVGIVPAQSSFVLPTNSAFQVKARSSNTASCFVTILELLYA